jgi:hypothetical protein
MMDDFLIDEDAGFAYVATHRENTIDRMLANKLLRLPYLAAFPALLARCCAITVMVVCLFGISLGAIDQFRHRKMSSRRHAGVSRRRHWLLRTYLA